MSCFDNLSYCENLSIDFDILDYMDYKLLSYSFSKYNGLAFLKKKSFFIALGAKSLKYSLSGNEFLIYDMFREI